MRRKNQIRIHTMSEQRERLTKLRQWFGQAGWLVVDVAYWYRQHELDFIAIKGLGQPVGWWFNIPNVLLVRPRRHGVIEIRAYQHNVIHLDVKKDLHESGMFKPLWWSRRVLPPSKKRGGWWSLIDERCMEEVRQALNKHHPKSAA